MAWKLKILFDDGTEELVDEDFETEEAANNEFQEWLDNWVAGAEALSDDDEGGSDASIEDCEIWEE